MNEEGIYRLLEAMSDRITDLQESYRVLNDHSTDLRLEVTELKARLDMLAKIAMWLLAPISGLTLLLRICEMLGVIN